MANWQHKVMTNDELKELVRGVYDMKYFVSQQCENHMISMVFMPIMFLGSSPTEPTLGSDNQVNRKKKLEYIEDLLTYERETPEREDFMKNIGMLYEEYSKAGPTSINGMPSFFSCKIVSIEDTIRFRDMYSAYCEMRKKFEKEWGTEKV